MNLGIALCIGGMLTHPQRPTGKVLNWKLVAFLGALSCSLYIWKKYGNGRDRPGIELSTAPPRWAQ